MGRMKEIDLVLRDIDMNMEDMNKKFDQILHLLRDMVRLEDSIKRLEEKIDSRITAMADRLCEMALIKAGQGVEAVQLRSQATKDTRFSEEEAWQEEPDDWADLDRMDLKG